MVAKQNTGKYQEVGYSSVYGEGGYCFCQKLSQLQMIAEKHKITEI